MVGTPSGQIEYRERRPLRRVVIFVAVFLISSTASLTYVYRQPVEYRAATRLQISPALTVAEADQIKPPSLQDQPAEFLTEVQALTSRPVLELAINRLKRDHALAGLGPNPVDAVQDLLKAEPLEHTEVVELSAEGPQQDLLWRLVNAVADAYRDRIGGQYRQQVSDNYDDIKDEVDKLHGQVVTKRTAVDAFRAANNIVSLERDENSVLADIQNLSHSYSTSLEALAKAQGHVQALKNVTGTGATLVSGKDDPTIAAMEQQVSELRDELTDLQRRYTPAYLALDADATALERRIAGLERQIAAQRSSSEKSTIAGAEEEFETAQAQVDRLRSELSENQKKAQQFATKMAQYKSMQEDLDHLENIERLTSDRLTKMQASERESAPKIEILERAAPSLNPVRPNYTANAAVAVSGSFALGIFAVWFAAFLGGAATIRSMNPETMPIESWETASLPRFSDKPLRLPGNPVKIRLLQHDPAPRELDEREIVALIVNASEPVILACVALLSGLNAEEVTALHWEQIDFDTREIRIEGDCARVLALQEPFFMLLQRQHVSANPSLTVLHDGRGNRWPADELARGILCAAYDAALPRPEEVTPEALRHTYLAWLFGQGIRAADMSRIAGNIPHEDLVGFMHLANSGARLPIDEIDLVHPAVRSLLRHTS